MIEHEWAKYMSYMMYLNILILCIFIFALLYYFYDEYIEHCFSLILSVFTQRHIKKGK